MPHTHYLNTDLDIISTQDLSGINTAIQDNCNVITAEQGADGRWYLCAEAFESGDITAKDHHPDKDLAALLHLLESLSEAHKQLLQQAQVFEFNIGLESFEGISAKVLHLSPGLIARVATLGATIGMSLYPVQPK